MWVDLVFYLIAAICVLSAIGVVVSSNPVHAAVFLGMCFLNIAAIFVMLGADFLAVVQVIIYTGAILVLVLFVVMLVDWDRLPQFHATRPVQRYVGLLLGLILLLEIGAAIINRTVSGPSGTATPQNVAAVGGNTQALGRTLYTDYLFPFEVASLVLLVGTVGAIVLALPERLGEQVGQRRATISLGHPRGVDVPALAAGPRGESSIPMAEPGQGLPEEARGGLILVKDPDVYTDFGLRPVPASEVNGNVHEEDPANAP